MANNELDDYIKTQKSLGVSNSEIHRSLVSAGYETHEFNHLLEKHCAKLDKPLKKLSSDAMDTLVGRTWEGNVREMENLIMQGILFSRSDEITRKDMGLERNTISGTTAEITPLLDRPYKEAKESNLQAFNEAYIGHMLNLNNGNVTQAAKACGLERQALQQIMRRYGISAERYRKPS